MQVTEITEGCLQFRNRQTRSDSKDVYLKIKPSKAKHKSLLTVVHATPYLEHHNLPLQPLIHLGREQAKDSSEQESPLSHILTYKHLHSLTDVNYCRRQSRLSVEKVRKRKG